MTPCSAAVIVAASASIVDALIAVAMRFIVRCRGALTVALAAELHCGGDKPAGLALPAAMAAARALRRGCDDSIEYIS
jgi:hypothetical protein